MIKKCLVPVAIVAALYGGTCPAASCGNLVILHFDAVAYPGLLALAISPFSTGRGVSLWVEDSHSRP